MVIVSVGKISAPWINQGVSLFENRLEKYIKINSIVIPDPRNAKNMSIDQIKEEEGKSIMTLLQPSDFVVLLDERGRELTSHEFAEWMQKQMNMGRKRLVLIIGGPYGFSQSLYKRAESKISLSKMTFTHEMAKLFLTEQIYRAMTILRGEPYHHD